MNRGQRDILQLGRKLYTPVAHKLLLSCDYDITFASLCLHATVLYDGRSHGFTYQYTAMCNKASLKYF